MEDFENHFAKLTAIQAVDRYRNDHRFRHMVMSAVSLAMQRDRREPDEHDYRRWAHDIATDAAATLLEMVYQSDAELHALRHERDAYRKLAEGSLTFTNQPPIMTRRASPASPHHAQPRARDEPLSDTQHILGKEDPRP